MRRWWASYVVVSFVAVFSGAIPAYAQSPAFRPVAQSDKTSGQSDDEIRDLIIRNSIARYPGPCACPFDRASNGSRCGKRSAYSKPGGYSPLCYRADIPERMVEEFRRLQET